MPDLALIWAALAVITACLIAMFERQNKMSDAVNALEANEAALETVVAAVVADNATIHADLTAALAANPDPAIQAVADKIAAQTAKLSALVPPPAAPSA